MASLAAFIPTAVEQALGLFEPENRPADVRMPDGYLDLLGEGDISRPYFAQRSMQSRIVPPLYEHLLHPFYMRVAAGIKAPGRYEEQMIALQMLGLSRGDRVLDVACGPGNFTRRFAGSTGDGLVVGLDASKVMLVAAARRTQRENVAYIRGDACALPFRASSFDAVNCFGAMHLFAQPLQALDEFMRVLAPGGRVALLTTCDENRSGPREDQADRRFSGWLIFGRDELTGALGKQGFTDIEQRVMRLAQFVSARKPAD
jgi:ubiquinone/menaquinone biosynthesis C-methylase UbiE